VEKYLKINLAELFINKNRVELVKKICGDKSCHDLENAFENAFDNISNTLDEETNNLIKFLTKLDNIHEIDPSNLGSYSLKNKRIHIIKNEADLNTAVLNLENAQILGFDTEQKPIFKKGVPPSPIAIIQISDDKDCYLFQVHLIRNIQPLLAILTNPNIIKVGIGLNGDNAALHNEFNIRPKSCLDFGSLFKTQMSYKDDIGAKRSVLLFLNENLQKSKKLSRSNWESNELSDSQIRYASEDASCVYDVFCSMLTSYPFLIKILPYWFQDKYNDGYFTSLK
jgi:hypothetical protein